MSLKRAAILPALLLLFMVKAAHPAQPRDRQAGSQNAPPATMEATAPIVLIGASFAADWHLAPIAGHQVINHAVSGQETPEFLARFDRDVVAERPRAVILWGYVNNIFNAPEGQAEQAVARARDDFQQMIANARTAGIEVILCTEITIGPKVEDWVPTVKSWIGWMIGRESYEDWINTHVLALNAWLTETAKREGMLLLDLQPVLIDARGRRTRESRSADGGHLTPTGYQALTAYAQPILEEHFRHPATAAAPR
jgi:lysophospholipase L1-like esterase